MADLHPLQPEEVTLIQEDAHGVNYGNYVFSVVIFNERLSASSNG